MHCTVCFVIVTGNDYLVGEFRRIQGVEQFKVVGVQTVAAGLDEFLGNLGALFKIPCVRLGIGGECLQEDITCVVFAEGSLKEQESRFEGHRRPFGDFVGMLVCGEISNGKVYVLYHFAHYELTAVAGPVQLFGLGRAQGMAVPRHVAETLHLLKIEVDAEETGDCLIFDAYRRVGTVIQVFYKGVDVTEGAPAPAAAAGGNGAFTHPLVGHIVLGIVVVVGHVKAFTGESLVEHDGESPELTFALEESVLCEFILGYGIQQVVAGYESEPGKHQENVG